MSMLREYFWVNNFSTFLPLPFYIKSTDPFGRNMTNNIINISFVEIYTVTLTTPSAKRDL